MRQIIVNYKLKDFLLKIYKCKISFELIVINKKPKRRLGTYLCANHKIIVYSKDMDIIEIKHTAIHEYAHHIHETEQGGIHGHGRYRSHGEIFWRIYSALMAEASKRGLFEDPLIQDIVIY